MSIQVVCLASILACSVSEIEFSRESTNRNDDVARERKTRANFGDPTAVLETLVQQQAATLQQMQSQLTAVNNDLTSTKNALAGTANQVTAILNELTATKNELAATKNVSAALQTNLSATQNELSATTSILVKMHNDLSATKIALSATASELSATKNELTAAKNNLTRNMSTLQTSLSTEQHNLATMKQDLSGAKAQISALKHSLPSTFSPVAFTAKFSTDNGGRGVPMRSHAILHFDNVISNVGNAYSPHTGVFTAPHPGLYLFFLSVMAVNHKGTVYVEIRKNGELLDKVFSNGANNDQGSTEVTVHLNAHDRVHAQQYYGTAIRGGPFTIFTGCLLQAD